MSIIIALLVIAVLALVHEWGHFIAARKIGIPVDEFSIGFGPLLWSREKNGVQYSLRAVPLGGYVRMAGEEPDDVEAENGFARRKPWEKITVAAAGPLMNFVFALVVFIVLFAGLGVPRVIEEPVIGGVLDEYPAQAAGLEPGDLIVAVDQAPVTTWVEFTERISALPVGSTVVIAVERAEERLNFTLATVANESTGRSLVGITNSIVYERQSWLASVRSGLMETYGMTVALLGGLRDMVTGQVGADDIAGPVGIVNMIGESARGGWLNFLSFTGFLSINLAVLNLLPIPALDGSKIVFALIESVRRKPLPLEKEAMVHLIGFVFLITLIVMVTFNDVMRLFAG
jgi:regulator of sigma E protease